MPHLLETLLLIALLEPEHAWTQVNPRDINDMVPVTPSPVRTTRVTTTTDTTYTKLTMAEAKSLIKIGMSEKEISDKFGKPTLVVDKQPPGLCWLYCAAPPESDYGGFAVIFKNHKVIDLERIQGTG